MSTFLVSLGVVAAAIAAVVYVVLNGPDQPATIRRQPSRAERRRERRAKALAAEAEARAAAPPAPAAPAPSPRVVIPAGPALALPESEVMRLRVLAAGQTTLWVRVRSFVALVVLVAVLGALLALAIGGLMFGVALLVRSATG